MGDMGELFSEIKDRKRKMRMLFGVACPRCNIKEPKRTPSILLPQQRCKVDGYVDPRPLLTKAQKEKLK